MPMNKTSQCVNPYVELVKDYENQVFFDQQARANKGQWGKITRSLKGPLHVEIGTGNGYHFSNYAEANRSTPVFGFEIKYKELVQSIRRATRAGCENAWMIKGDAKYFCEYYAANEVEKVMIHFPDPWPKRRHQKNRLIKKEFLQDLYSVLVEDGVVEFKTDHYGYFKWATRQVAHTNWRLTYYTEDLHKSLVAKKNYVTHFENIFLKKEQPIFYFELRK